MTIEEFLANPPKEADIWLVEGKPPLRGKIGSSPDFFGGPPTRGYRVANTVTPFDTAHKNIVKYALKEGKSVPQEVLRDYPDLIKTSDNPTKHIPEEETEFIPMITLPASLLKALYALQKEPTTYEWGGGIDFEIIAGVPQVERILAYFGEKGHIPSRVLKKYGRDIEVTFHTHPRQRRVQPSAGDITSFVRSPAQVSMIIAGEEIGLFEKRADFETLIKDPPSISLPTYYEPKIAMPKIKEDLNRIGIDVFIYPRGVAPPVFDLEIVRRIVGEEHVS